MDHVVLFDCLGLKARLSPTQCKANRTRPVSSSLANLPTRPKACLFCTQWNEFDPPANVTDPAELALAETLATLWPDIDEGRLGVKFILTAYNRRVMPELRKRRSLLMADWLVMLGFRVLHQEQFQGVSGLRCLWVDSLVEGFVREKGFAVLQRTDVAALDRLLGVVGLKQDAPLPEEDPEESEEREAAEPVATEEATAVAQPFVRSKPLADAAPCPECRFFRPMPTYHAGVEGIRLCWADVTLWEFACFKPRQEGMAC